MLMSRQNPYYAKGQNFSGIGFVTREFTTSESKVLAHSGPHIAAWNPWPMSQITNIFGSDDDDEILESLYMVVNVSPSGATSDCDPTQRIQNTAGLGLIHESINIYDGDEYTRSWFAWANSYFSEMILDLAQRKPHLLFDNCEPYMPGQ